MNGRLLREFRIRQRVQRSGSGATLHDRSIKKKTSTTEGAAPLHHDIEDLSAAMSAAPSCRGAAPHDGSTMSAAEPRFTIASILSVCACLSFHDDNGVAHTSHGAGGVTRNCLAAAYKWRRFMAVKCVMIVIRACGVSR